MEELIWLNKYSSRSSLERYHLRKQVQELENKTSHIQSTTLVTLYIPPGTRLSDITQKLTDEMGTATSIKDKIQERQWQKLSDQFWQGCNI